MTISTSFYSQSTIWNESKGRLMQALSPPASPKRDGSPNGSNSSNNDDDHTRYITAFESID